MAKTERALEQDGALKARALRACQETFTLVPTQEVGVFWCYSHRSAKTYHTNENTCDCPDAQHRANPAGLPCKHSLAIRNADPDALRRTPSSDPNEAARRVRRAEDARRFEELFS